MRSGVLLAALLAGMLLAHRITVPLRRLVRGAEQVGRGDLDHRIGLAHRDDIGAVARAFDQMTAELKSTLVSRDELSTEIGERARAEEALRDAGRATAGHLGGSARHPHGGRQQPRIHLG